MIRCRAGYGRMVRHVEFPFDGATMATAANTGPVFSVTTCRGCRTVAVGQGRITTDYKSFLMFMSSDRE